MINICIHSWHSKKKNCIRTNVNRIGIFKQQFGLVLLLLFQNKLHGAPHDTCINLSTRIKTRACI